MQMCVNTFQTQIAGNGYIFHELCTDSTVATPIVNESGNIVSCEVILHITKQTLFIQLFDIQTS